MNRQQKGFSLVEVVLVVTIGMILIAVAIPVVQRAVRNYTLSGACSNVSRIIQLTRSTAVRQGTLAQTLLAGNLFGVDANLNGQLDANEPAAVLPSGVQLSAAGPAPAGMPFTTTPATLGDPFSITFTPRGTPCLAPPCGAPVVSMIYVAGLESTNAITISAAGHPRVWRHSGDAWY